MTKMLSQTEGLGLPDISKIDEGTGVARKCFNCGYAHKHAICITDTGVRTNNRIGICVNKKCFRYTDVEKLAGWMVE